MSSRLLQFVEHSPACQEFTPCSSTPLARPKDSAGSKKAVALHHEARITIAQTLWPSESRSRGSALRRRRARSPRWYDLDGAGKRHLPRGSRWPRMSTGVGSILAGASFTVCFAHQFRGLAHGRIRRCDGSSGTDHVFANVFHRSPPFSWMSQEVVVGAQLVVVDPPVELQPAQRRRSGRKLITLLTSSMSLLTSSMSFARARQFPGRALR